MLLYQIIYQIPDLVKGFLPFRVQTCQRPALLVKSSPSVEQAIEFAIIVY